MRSKGSPTKAHYSSANCRSRSPSPSPLPSPPPPPPPGICSIINDQVHSNPALGCANFDFAAHVQHRSYVVHDYLIGDFQGTALLDKGVERLLPHTLEPAIPSPTNLVEILNTGKRGYGMFARHDFIPEQGLILVEHPVVITPYLVGLTTPLSNLYSQLFDRLPPKLYRDLMRLSNCKLPAECSSFEGIVRTNAIGIQLDVPDVPHSELSTHRAIFLNTSRCNHRLVIAPITPLAVLT
jgi:hypothetical protein